MIIYITGASGVGKTTVMKDLPIKSYDLDDLYEKQWKLSSNPQKVKKGVKEDIEGLTKKHKNLCFVGLAMRADLPFTPDHTFILIRKDWEQYYRQKLVRDLELLCKYKKDFIEVLEGAPLKEFRNHFWSNDVVNMKSLEDFKKHQEHITKAIQKDFSGAKQMEAKEVVKFIQKVIE